MKIQFERTGGFAGMRVETTIDTQSLPSQEASELQEMVDAAGFFDLPATIAAPTPGADQFQYKVTIEAGGRQHTIETGDAALPDALWPLLRRLTALARSTGGS